MQKPTREKVSWKVAYVMKDSVMKRYGHINKNNAYEKNDQKNYRMKKWGEWKQTSETEGSEERLWRSMSVKRQKFKWIYNMP